MNMEPSAAGSIATARMQDPSLLGLPTELRLKIYSYLFDDLIEELSDNLFGVFWMYDHMYDYTSAHMYSHVGKTGLTPILRTCKQIYPEALSVLCEKGNFLVNILGEEDSLDEERSPKRFSDGSRHLALAKHLRVNFIPWSDESTDRFVGRIIKFLEVIQCGADLWSLEIRFDKDIAQVVGAESWDRILTVLSALKLQVAVPNVYVGEISEEDLSDEKLALFMDSIGG